MRYSVPATSTLYIKARLRKSPCSNKVVALRLTANFYQDFKHNDVLYMRELNPNCTSAQLKSVIASLQELAHAASVRLDMPPAVSKLFEG